MRVPAAPRRRCDGNGTPTMRRMSPKTCYSSNASRRLVTPRDASSSPMAAANAGMSPSPSKHRASVASCCILVRSLSALVADMLQIDLPRQLTIYREDTAEFKVGKKACKLTKPLRGGGRRNCNASIHGKTCNRHSATPSWLPQGPFRVACARYLREGAGLPTPRTFVRAPCLGTYQGSAPHSSPQRHTHCATKARLGRCPNIQHAS